MRRSSSNRLWPRHRPAENSPAGGANGASRAAAAATACAPDLGPDPHLAVRHVATASPAAAAAASCAAAATAARDTDPTRSILCDCCYILCVCRTSLRLIGTSGTLVARAEQTTSAKPIICRAGCYSNRRVCCGSKSGPEIATAASARVYAAAAIEDATAAAQTEDARVPVKAKNNAAAATADWG